VGPDFLRAVVQGRQRNLKIEDARAYDIQLICDLDQTRTGLDPGLRELARLRDALGAPIDGGTIDIRSGSTKYRITVTPMTGRVTIAPVP